MLKKKKHTILLISQDENREWFMLDPEHFVWFGGIITRHKVGSRDEIMPRAQTLAKSVCDGINLTSFCQVGRYRTQRSHSPNSDFAFIAFEIFQGSRVRVDRYYLKSFPRKGLFFTDGLRQAFYEAVVYAEEHSNNFLKRQQVA